MKKLFEKHEGFLFSRVIVNIFTGLDVLWTEKKICLIKIACLQVTTPFLHICQTHQQQDFFFSDKNRYVSYIKP